PHLSHRHERIPRHRRMGPPARDRHERRLRPPGPGDRGKPFRRRRGMNAADHSTFVIERELPTGPKHAFRFWSDAAMKQRWNACHPDWTVLEDVFEFHVGGTEARRWRTHEGHEQTFAARYFDIEPQQRIIYAFEMS